MDNYKIKVNDEAESKEAQELFFELGFRWKWTQDKEVLRESTPYLFTLGANIGYGLTLTKFDECVGKELTLPQLRDLVVLKRNSMDDQNHVRHGCVAYLDSDGYTYTYDKQLECWIKTDDKPITQDPALISGADVPALIKKGESVQFRSVFNVQGGGEWKDLNLEGDEEEFSLGDLINTRFEWRLKPQTIKLELELPKPFEPKVGQEVWFIDDNSKCGYSRSAEYGSDIYSYFGWWRTEDEIKQVVEQLRKIRGTNS